MQGLNDFLLGMISELSSANKKSRPRIEKMVLEASPVRHTIEDILAEKPLMVSIRLNLVCDYEFAKKIGAMIDEEIVKKHGA